MPGSSTKKLGRPLGYLIVSLMALIGDHIYEYLLKGILGANQGKNTAHLRS